MNHIEAAKTSRITILSISQCKEYLQQEAQVARISASELVRQRNHC